MMERRAWKLAIGTVLAAALLVVVLLLPMALGTTQIGRAHV